MHELADQIIATAGQQPTPARVRAAALTLFRGAEGEQLTKLGKPSWQALEAFSRELAKNQEQWDPVAREAGNALYEAISIIRARAQARRVKRREEGRWVRLAPCEMCWRWAPAGNSSRGRPPRCPDHESGTKGYHRARRVQAHMPKVRQAILARIESSGLLSPAPANWWALEPLSQGLPPATWRSTKEAEATAKDKSLAVPSSLPPNVQEAALAALKGSYREPLPPTTITPAPHDLERLEEHLPHVFRLIRQIKGSPTPEAIIEVLDAGEDKDGIRAGVHSAWTTDLGLAKGLLVDAEAWLAVYAAHHPGGRRKNTGGRRPGAGRKRVHT